MMSFQEDLQPNAIGAMKLVRQQMVDAERAGEKLVLSRRRFPISKTTLTIPRSRHFKILQSLELSMTLCDAKNASPESTEQQNLEW